MTEQSYITSTRTTGHLKAIDKADGYHGPVREAESPRTDPTAPTLVMACPMCGKEASEADQTTPTCKCGLGLEQVVSRKVLHNAGHQTTPEAKPGKILTDIEAWRAWRNAGAKPHPVFARAAWLALHCDANGIIQPTPVVGCRLMYDPKCSCDDCVASRAAISLAEYHEWLKQCVAVPSIVEGKPRYARGIKAMSDSFIWLEGGAK